MELEKILNKKPIQAQYFHYQILETFDLSKLEEYKDHRRLRVFYNKGCKCVECGIEGTIVALGKDRGGSLHLDVYTNDYYPLTIDHILPKSKGGSDELDNLQPMCCLCNWSKGNGDKSVRNGAKKYSIKNNGEFDIDGLPFFDDTYTKENIQIGDEVYVRTKKNGRKLRKLGEVEKFCMNPHTSRESIMLKGNNISIHHLSKIYKKL